MRTTRLRVTLREVEPEVERVIDVPAAITLDDLHKVLQVALGWTDSHLHEFRTAHATYAVPFEQWDDEESVASCGTGIGWLRDRRWSSAWWRWVGGVTGHDRGDVGGVEQTVGA
jgi:Plasmid pRiA4b ORF-3-like protein